MNLSKIYEKIIGKVHPLTKKVPTKFTPLSETYTSIYFKNNINEQVDVLMQEPGQDIETYNITTNLANKLKKEIKRDTKFTTEQGEETVNTILDKILTIKGWKQGNKQYINVLERVQQIFSTGNLIPEKLTNLQKIHSSPETKLTTLVLNNPEKAVNIKDIIPELFNEMFHDNNGYSVVEALWKVEFKAKVNVGQGELALTLISNATKGKTGDLVAGGVGDIEIKGSGARMGGDGFCHNNTPEELNKILKAITSTSLPEKILQRIKNSVISSIDNAIKQRLSLKISRPEQTIFLQKIKQSINQADNLNEVLQELNNTDLPEKIKSPIINGIKKYIEHLRQEVKSVYSPAVKTFFEMANDLTDDQLIEGLVAARNYKSTPAILNELKQGIKEIFINEKSTLFSNTEITLNLYKLIAAIHTTLYQIEQNFKYIVFLNDQTYKLISLKFEDSSVKNNLILIYNFYKNNKAFINLSIEAKFKSTGITLPL